MDAKTQIWLTMLVFAAIGLSTYAFVGGGRIYAVVSCLVVMPAVALLTFLSLARAEKRRMEKRFPGRTDGPGGGTSAGAPGEKDG